MLLFILTGITGTFIWTYEIDFWFGKISINVLMFAFYILGSISTTVTNLNTVRNHIKNSNDRVVLNHHPSYKTAPILTMMPIISVIVLSVVWWAVTPQLLTQQPRGFILTVGWLFSYIMIRHIVIHVTKEPFVYWFYVELALIVVILNSFIVAGDPLVDVFIVMWIYLGIIALCCVHVMTVVTMQISSHLKFHPFKVLPQLPTTM